MQKLSLILTGATGLVGSRFVELYRDQFEIYNLDLATGVDITNAEQVEAFISAHSATALIHLAAFTDTARAESEAGDKEGICYRVNVLGTKNIVEACQKHSLYLIHVSTDFVFDGNKSNPYTEEDLKSPIEWYGETKAMAEDVVTNSKLNYSIVRISYPYRANYNLKPDIIGKIRAGLESGKLYPQFTDTIITPTLIDDIARAFAVLVDRQLTGIYHVVGSTSLSPYDLAKKVATIYGFDPSVVKEGSLTEYLKTATRPFARYVAMSNVKATSELGLSFASLEAGLFEIKKQQIS
ncbi:MAG: hypothetical protein DPW11_03015 [bacterium]|nr:NAD(P)-dependent oxidoreductase [Candidatus Microgenomates bacterium CPR3]MCQ3944721.1 hypothetical protein [bacterium]RIK51862.1 MAG: hypothetical protein DCC61_01415 [Candidatus Microgenomates bacterium]